MLIRLQDLFQSPEALKCIRTNGKVKSSISRKAKTAIDTVVRSRPYHNRKRHIQGSVRRTVGPRSMRWVATVLFPSDVARWGVALLVAWDSLSDPMSDRQRGGERKHIPVRTLTYVALEYSCLHGCAVLDFTTFCRFDGVARLPTESFDIVERLSVESKSVESI